MDVKEKIRYWDSLVSYDLETADVMLAGHRFLYVGFMCHQSMEKALKAYHWAHIGSEPDYTHALVRLAKRSDVYEKMDEGFQNLLEVLEPLNVETRYPTEKEKLLSSLDYERCAGIVTETKRWIAWLRMLYVL